MCTYVLSSFCCMAEPSGVSSKQPCQWLRLRLAIGHCPFFGGDSYCSSGESDMRSLLYHRESYTLCTSGRCRINIISMEAGPCHFQLRSYWVSSSQEGRWPVQHGRVLEPDGCPRVRGPVCLDRQQRVWSTCPPPAAVRLPGASARESFAVVSGPQR